LELESETGNRFLSETPAAPGLSLLKTAAKEILEKLKNSPSVETGKRLRAGG